LPVPNTNVRQQLTIERIRSNEQFTDEPLPVGRAKALPAAADRSLGDRRKAHEAPVLHRAGASFGVFRRLKLTS